MLAGSRRAAMALSLLLVPGLKSVEPPAAAKPAYSEPSLSPDKHEIAFVSGGNIWTVPAAGGEARLLVAHAAFNSRPLCSPDGLRLAFQSTRTGNGDLYVLTLATGELKRITFDDAAEQLDAWSRDGKWLYFSSGSKDVNGMNDLFRVSVDGGTPMAVSADRFTQEYWSNPSPNDANTIAFTGKGRTSTDWWRKGHAHIDESQIWLAHIGGATPAYDAVTTGGSKDAWPDVGERRKDAVLRVGPQWRREHLGAHDRCRAGQGGDVIQQRSRGVADDVVRRQDDRFRARLRDLESRRGERPRD